jgi:hypothetical protein
MPKVKISEYSTTNSANTDIESINIDEGCAPSGINNAIRELMVHLKEFQTGSSGDPLTVAGTFVASGGATLSGTNTLSGSTVMTASAGTSASPSIHFSSDTNTGIFSPAADTIAFAEGGAEAMRIDSSGRLLVGTTSSIGSASVGRVQILGGETFITTNSEVGGFVGVNSNIDNSVAIVADPDSLRSGSHIAFYVDAFSEKARITSGGDLLVGITNNDPTFNRTNGCVLRSGGSVLSRSAGGSDFGVSTSSGTNIAFYTDNGSARVTAGSITSNGATTAYGLGSDYRMKTNVQPMTGALAKVLQLNPVTFIWKEKFAGTNPNGQGFIAHELQEFFPDAVVGEKDAVNKDGSIKPQSVDTSFLVATLTAAIQEQQQIINDLKARLDAANL